MSHLLLIFVLLIPLATAVLMLFLWNRTVAQRYVGSLSMLLHLAFSILLFQSVLHHGMQVELVGSWPKGMGIALVADKLSVIFLLISSLAALSAFIYAGSFIKEKISLTIFHPVFFFLVFGLSGAFLAGDIFNLYVWFEVMLVSSFVLFTIGASRSQLEGSLKYVTINVFSSALFLIGVGLLFGLTGNLNMAFIAKALPKVANQNLVSIAALFFLMSFGIKAAMFPMFFWLPASYHTAPIGFTALVVALLTKVGVYSLSRIFTLMVPIQGTSIQTILLVLSAFTMVVGVLGAAAQTDFRKILTFHIVSQIGYMIMGLAILTPYTLGGAIFFVIHNVLVKTNLFFIAGLVGKMYGTHKLKELGGVMNRLPLLAMLFAISAFSLTGIPPLTGFWGKYLLAKGGFETGNTLIIIVTSVSLGVSLLTLFSMTKIWNEVFWKPFPNVCADLEENTTFMKIFKTYPGMMIAILFLTLAILAISFFPGSTIEWSIEAAKQVLDRNNYLNLF